MVCGIYEISPLLDKYTTCCMRKLVLKTKGFIVAFIQWLIIAFGEALL